MNKVLEADREGPNPIDRHVGLRIRMRRKELGLSQERLADSIGLTFQQVQKYERAANRVSASKLWEMSRALRTNVAYFFEGLGETAPGAGQAPDPVQEFLLTPEGLELARAFAKVSQVRVRRRLVELVRAMADEVESARA